MTENEKPCKRGCRKIIVYKGKTDKKGSTGFFEKDDPKIEHTFSRCDNLIVEQQSKAERQKGQAKLL